MKHFSLENKPSDLVPYRRKSISYIKFIDEPFIVETQEGLVEISPDTVDDWDGGYYLVYPEDGSKPYTNSPKYVRDNLEAV